MHFTNRFEVLPGGKKHIAPPLTPQDGAIADLPAVPVLAETLLRMELEVREPATDLRTFTQAVLGDVGATIQILRLAGQEFDAVADRPVRIEDCISLLGPRACLETVTKGSFVGTHTHTRGEYWAHAKDVAQYFKLFAGLGAPGVTPDQAYLTGLLHALGALPSVLGWGNVGLDGDVARVALALAEQWRLPRFVIDFFGEVLLPGHCPAWAKFVTVAHHPAKESWQDCPLAHAQNLSLRRAAGAMAQN